MNPYKDIDVRCYEPNPGQVLSSSQREALWSVCSKFYVFSVVSTKIPSSRKTLRVTEILADEGGAATLSFMPPEYPFSARAQGVIVIPARQIFYPLVEGDAEYVWGKGQLKLKRLIQIHTPTKMFSLKQWREMREKVIKCGQTMNPADFEAALRMFGSAVRAFIRRNGQEFVFYRSFRWRMLSASQTYTSGMSMSRRAMYRAQRLFLTIRRCGGGKVPCLNQHPWTLMRHTGC